MAPGASSLKLTWRTVKPSTPAAWPSVSRTNSVSEPPSSVWRVSGASVTPSIGVAGPYDWTWKARLASRVKSIRPPEDSTRSRLAREHAQQVLAVRVVAHRLGDALDGARADPAHAIGDLLEAGDHHALPRLDRLDEGGRLQQRLVRAGVEPGHAAPELLDVQAVRAQIRGVDVGDLELAARRGHQPVRHLDHARVVEVESRHRPRRARPRRLLLDRHRPARAVELDHAVALGVPHPVGEDGAALGALAGDAQRLRQAVAVEEVVAQHERDRRAPDERAADPERLGDAVGPLLHRVLDAEAEVRSVAQQPLEGRLVVR